RMYPLLPAAGRRPVSDNKILRSQSCQIMTESAHQEVDAEYATAMAARANRYMAQLAVPPVPDNFAVWFNYATGASPGLKEAIDALIAGNKPFDAATN